MASGAVKLCDIREQRQDAAIGDLGYAKQYQIGTFTGAIACRAKQHQIGTFTGAIASRGAGRTTPGTRCPHSVRWISRRGSSCQEGDIVFR